MTTLAELDALIERQPWFPPADERTEWANQAAAALVQLREEAASWEAQVTDRDEMCLQQAARAERAESRANELEQARESIEEFSHMKTDRIAALEAERDALKQDAVWLLQRARAIINRWQELYGEHQPQFLPPAHQIEWAEDASEFIDAAREKP